MPGIGRFSTLRREGHFALCFYIFLAHFGVQLLGRILILLFCLPVGNDSLSSGLFFMPKM